MTVLSTREANRTRCWGWWPTLDEAKSALLLSPDFWLENGYYDLIVFEEVESGFSFDRPEHWYEAKWLGSEGPGDPVKYEIHKLDSSPHPNVINWSMG
jgi:hypothetical protein